MNAEVKAKWVAALRSGEFKQGKYTLRSASDRYCCFGVLCELAVQAGVIQPGVKGVLDTKYEASTCGPGTKVRKWSEVPQDQVSTLMGMNDGTAVTLDGMNFNQIANYIEDNL